MRRILSKLLGYEIESWPEPVARLAGLCLCIAAVLVTRGGWQIAAVVSLVVNQGSFFGRTKWPAVVSASVAGLILVVSAP